MVTAYFFSWIQCSVRHLMCCAKSLWSYLTLCATVDCSLPGSSVAGILQARILEWVVMPSSRWSSRPRDWTQVSYVSCIDRGFFTVSATREAPIFTDPGFLSVACIRAHINVGVKLCHFLSFWFQESNFCWKIQSISRLCWPELQNPSILLSHFSPSPLQFHAN